MLPLPFSIFAGNNPGNVNKELKAWLGEPSLPVTRFQAPFGFKYMRQGGRPTEPTISEIDLPFMLPHLVFSYMYKHDKPRFEKKFLGPPVVGKSFSDKLQDFWDCVIQRRDPRIMRHPMCARPNWQRWAIPLAIHGDGMLAVPLVRVGSRCWWPCTGLAIPCFDWSRQLLICL